MTTTSFNARQPEYRPLVGTLAGAGTSELADEKDPAHVRHSDEIQRMKDFAGRRRFQAPVADDFARGMLEPGHDLMDRVQPSKHVRGALAAVIVGLRALCGGQKAQGNPADDSRAPD
ncbi:hypothetical protein ACI77M_10590 [Pseudomonas fildesensis]|uniref:hypothetical protein n=1 Tax=Pseudomonas fildesensis TaxID=1674920 RepID=UPI00387B7D9F